VYFVGFYYKKNIDVCRKINQLKRRQFLINHKLYHYFIITIEILFILTRNSTFYINVYRETLLFSIGVISLRVAIAMEHVGTN